MYNYDVDLVKSVKVIYDDMFMVSDHLPVLTTIKTSIMLTVLPNKKNIAWQKVSDSNIQSYQHTLATLLHFVRKTNVDIMYFDVINSIIKAANDCLPKTTFNKHANPYRSPGVKRVHDTQRHARRKISIFPIVNKLQKHIGGLTASIVLQESIYHN